MTTKPSYLYRFSASFDGGDPWVWRFTSNDEAITSAAETFAPWPITHGEISRSIHLDSSESSLEAAYEASGFWLLLGTARIQRRLKCEIFQVDRTAPDVRELLLTGSVQKPKIRERTISVEIVSWMDVFDSELPWFADQNRCNYRFGDANCKFDLSLRRSIIPAWNILPGRRHVMMSFGIGSPAPGWLYYTSMVGGQFRWPGMEGEEGIPIVCDVVAQQGPGVGDSTVVTIELNKALPADVGGGHALIIGGCDRTIETCGTFGNTINFGGFPNLPRKNLSVSAWDTDNASQSKKSQ